jgi:hypothetical protein
MRQQCTVGCSRALHLLQGTNQTKAAEEQMQAKHRVSMKQYGETKLQLRSPSPA